MKTLNISILYIILFSAFSSCGNDTKKKKSIKISTPTKISAFKTTLSTFKNYIELQGNVQSNKNILMKIETSGILKNINVKEGQYVQKGDLLAELNCEVINANIIETEINLEFAKDMYSKQEKLWKKKIGSQIKLLELKNKKESLEQKLNILKTQKKTRQIFAPFNGKIDEIFLHQSDLCSPQTPVLRIINTNKVYIKCDISEKHLNTISKNSPVSIRFENLNAVFNGKLIWISDYINPKNRCFKVKITLSNPKGLIKPNLIGRVKINYQTLENQITLPYHTIQQDIDGNYFVYTIMQQKNKKLAKKTIVKVGGSYNNIQLILSGLKADQWIVDKGAKNIQDGSEIEF